MRRERDMPVMRFERSSSEAVWRASAETAQSQVTAVGASLREARVALEQLLREASIGQPK
jgi:hypothetical protein